MTLAALVGAGRGGPHPGRVFEIRSKGRFPFVRAFAVFPLDLGVVSF